MSFVKVQNIVKKYGRSTILNSVNFSLEQGEQCVIKGASGSGKSTLLYLLGGLEKSNGGSIVVNGVNIGALNDDELAKFRNTEVGFVFQFHFLLSSLNCLENTLLPARLGDHNIAEVKKYVMHLAKRLGVEDCLKKYPYEISGGQQQRINLIRALSLKPSLLLCDEPTGNLDSKNSKLATELLIELSTNSGVTLLVVTHDDYVSSVFTNVKHMADGVLQ